MSVLLTGVRCQGSSIAFKVLRRDVQIPVNHLKVEILELVQVLCWNATHACNELIREVDVIVELGCYEHGGQNKSKIKQ